MSTKEEPPKPRSVAQILAASGLTDLELLYIADALFYVETRPGHPTYDEAQRCIRRHKIPQVSASTMEVVLKLRHVDSGTGTKVVTSIVDLLA